ncbi:MAG: gliding motility-associated C-terminal domain-containing protein [Bacteroidota bacterium]
MMHIYKTIVTGLILLFTIPKIQAQAVFTLEDVTAGTGSTFCMDVTAENLEGIISLQFSVNWNPTLLEFSSVQNLAPAFASGNVNSSGASAGAITFSFFGFPPATLPDNEVFFQLCFTVIGTTGGSTDVDFTGNPTSIEVATLLNPNLGLTTQGGTVTLIPPLIFNLPDTVQTPGSAFCLPVSVENFDNLESIQSAINWDPTVIAYDSVTNINLSDLSAASFGASMSDMGIIAFSWNDDDLDPFNGVTLPDGTVIFEICFTVVGDVNDATTVAFTDDPVPIEVIEFGSTDNLGLVSQGGLVNIQQALFVTNNTLTQPNCTDPEGGAIEISVAGGMSPYTYLWSNDSTTQDISGLTNGTYTVTIMDSSNPSFEFVETFELLGDFIVPIADAGGLDTISCTDPTTVLDGSGSSSGMNITYSWTHDAGTATILNGDTNMPTVNALGIYNLLVTDTNNGCTATSQAVVTGDVVPPIVNAGMPDTLTCAITELQLNATVNPMGVYTYAWTTTGGSFVSGQDSESPTINGAGTYEVVVTEMATGCTATDQVEIALNNNTPTSDAGNDMVITCSQSSVILDGSNSSSGTNISYSWNGLGIIDGINTNMATVNVTGTYTLEVTNDLTGCTAVSSVEVTSDATIPVAVVSDNNPTIDCTVQVVVLNGAGSSTGNNFTYLWTTPNGNIFLDSTALTAQASSAGEYFLTVTDTLNGCFSTDSTTITQDADLPVADAGPDRTLTCSVDSVQLDGSNSSLGGDYQYQWFTSGTMLNTTSVAPFVNSGGTYILEVTDTLTSCTAVSSVVVTVDTIPPVSDPPAPATLTCSQSEIVLLGGSASVSSDIAFSWFTTDGNIASFTNDADPVVDAVGNYCMILESVANGCADTSCVQVMMDSNEPTADAGVDFELNCDFSNDTLDGSGSSTGVNFIYQWVAISGDDPTDDTTLTPSITSAGEFIIIVTDTLNGCMSMDTVTVTEADDFPIVEAGVNATITCTDPEITLDASLVSSSGPGFMIEWAGPGLVNDSTTLTPIVNIAGTYTLTITNTSNNCAASDQVLVSINTNTPTAAVAQDTVAFDCDQTITLDGTGSTAIGVEYLWKTLDGVIDDGETTLEPTVSQGGTYTLCVTNPSNGCADTATVFVEPLGDTPDLEIEFPDNLTCNNPQVTLDASNSVLLPNQIFEWVFGPNGNCVAGCETNMITVDAPTFYTFLVTDTITGCTYATGALVLTDTTSVVAMATADGNLDCQNDLVNLEAAVMASSTNVIYSWFTPDGNITTTDTTQLTIQANAAGMYQFIAVDTLTGCADTVDIEIINDADPPIANAGIDVEFPCDVNSITIDGTSSSQGNDFTYFWTSPNGNIIFGNTTLSLEVGSAGTYILEVTNTTNGCIAIDTVEVVNSSDVVAQAVTPVQLDCGVLSVQLDGTGSSVGTNISYLWITTDGTIENGAMTLTPEVSAAGTYTLFVGDDTSGCTATAAVEVTFNNSFPNADAGEDMATCDPMTTLNANLPTDVTGIWINLGAAIPADPASPTTEVTNLQPGENIFIWTLSAIGCPEYSSDTVIIAFEAEAITANDDFYQMIEGEVLDFEVGDNDIFISGTFETLSSTMNGTLDDNGNGNFTYTPDASFVGTETFDYELCSDVCPDNCDDATVTITVTVEAPLPIDSLLKQNINTITPNDDGLNDAFIFDILVQNPNGFDNNEFLVFNRWGDIVYEARPYANDWQGTNNSGKPLPEGTYYYILRLDFAEGIIIKGDVTILR